MTTICYFSATGGDLAIVTQARDRLAGEGADISVTARGQLQLTDDAGIADFVTAALAADAVILSLHGGMDSCPGWAHLAPLLPDHGDPSRPYLHIQPAGSDDVAADIIEEYGDGLPDGRWARLVRLLDLGGTDNMVTALALVTTAVRERRGEGTTDLPQVADDPVPVPTEGLYLPEERLVTDEAAYLDSLDPGRPTVGLLFPQTYWVQHNTAHIDDLIAGLRARGAQVVPAFGHRFADEARGNADTRQIVDRFFRRDGRAVIDVLINAQSFSLLAVDPAAADIFPSLGVPVLQA